MISVIEIHPPPPRPWTTYMHMSRFDKRAWCISNEPLPVINIGMFCAAPQIADPIAKIVTNVRRAGLRPNTETSPPMTGSMAVEAIA